MKKETNLKTYEIKYGNKRLLLVCLEKPKIKELKEIRGLRFSSIVIDEYIKEGKFII